MKKYSILTLFLIIFSSCHRKTLRVVSAPQHTEYLHDTVFVSKPSAIQFNNLSFNLVDSLMTAVETATTPNFNLRRPSLVVLHHTAQNSCQQTLKTFSLSRTQVSAHYVICRDGTVYHILNDYLRAWHAGNSRWGNINDVNSCSIGIELDNDGKEPFPEPQINSLLTLLQSLKKNYLIPTANFIGHSDVAPQRKNDPSILFPWKKLAENGFGYWYDDTTLNNLSVDAGFDPIQALRVIGYNVKDTSKAILAFKHHFAGVESSGILNNGDLKILYALFKKYY